jgi:putative alpha-1,2-mannosidase
LSSTQRDATARTGAAAASGSLTQYVDPIIGTTGTVNDFPGADVPFGMVQFSPDTSPTRPAGGGYDFHDPAITGFSLTHVAGPGCGAFGEGCCRNGRSQTARAT